MSSDEDLDQKFQEDLERAQALSLESLALEKFKNQKRLERVSINSSEIINNASKNSSVCRSASVNETNYNNSVIEYTIKSRPRPGPKNNQSCSNFVPPPPVRKNNTTTAKDKSAVPDLISFTSPSKEDLNFFESTDGPSTNRPVSELSVNILSGLIAPQWQIAKPFLAYNSSPSTIIPQKNNGGAQKTPYSFNSNKQEPNRPSPLAGFNILSLYNNKTAISDHTQQDTAPPLPPKNQTMPPPPLAAKPLKTKKPDNSKSYYICDNLIDFTHSDSNHKNSVRVSILEDFDPLINSSDTSIGSSFTIPEVSDDDLESIYDSVYDEYDPYDFINSNSGKNSTSDPLYEAVLKSEYYPSLSPSPPLISRLIGTTITHKSPEKAETFIPLYENIKVLDKPLIDSDLIAFHRMVKHLREQFHYDDPDTNMGLIVSPMMHRRYKEGTSIKIVIHPQYENADFDKPVSFTCNVSCSVEHITQHVVCELDAPLDDQQYTLKVWGYNEYLVPTTLLSDYEYVHNCMKLEEDVLLILIPDKQIDRSLARTNQDDHRDKEINLEDLIVTDVTSVINNEQLKILLETLEKEISKLEGTKSGIVVRESQLSGVIQVVKLISNIIGNLETIEVTQALDELKSINQIVIGQDGSESVHSIFNHLRKAVQDLIEMYCNAFGIKIEIKNKVEIPLSPSKIQDVNETVLIRICSIHRPSLEWKYENYLIAAQVYHGTRPIGHPLLTQPSEISQSLYARILFNCWLDLEDIPISTLAREARLVLVIYGRKLQNDEEKDNSNAPQYKQEELGWASVQLFNYKGSVDFSVMTQGSMLLSIWPKECNYIYGPAPTPGSHPFHDHAVLAIEIAAPKVVFPATNSFLNSKDSITKGNFNSLDSQTHEQLLEISQQDMLCRLPPDIREVLWEKRHYLYKVPEALPKILLAAHSWAPSCLQDLYGMLYFWKQLSPVQAIQLLLPTFPDIEVRKLAVRWLHGIRTDELVDYLPQLVVALRHETYENNALAHFLLDRSLRSPRIAHHLFWLLTHTLPGSTPQNGKFTVDQESIADARYFRRMLVMLRSLFSICGESLRNCFLSQQILVKELNDVAERVKKTKESHRLVILSNGMEGINQHLRDNPTSLPLSPTLRVNGVNVENCSYFQSNTLPLKIIFIANDGSSVPAIYKVGDDLQQDQLVLQMVRIMDKMWLKEGLDLKMVTFSCIPTGKKKGIIELVANAETLRKIQVEHGLTGSFKDKPIAEWLAKHNPSELEYTRAVENFTASCAGYCVVTYILGVCDRHNDNIMLKTSGHLFHIDFGKFLGDAQMFGNFKRDRAPFVLTTDMAYVINCGDRPSEKFHRFVDLCCQAFNIVRSNGNFFLHLFTLMASSGIRGITSEAVSHLRKSLMLEQSNPEAAAHFARLIESSLKSWFTQVNFFLHNLAQLKFSTASCEDQLLSFVPKIYSMSTDGRLTHVAVVGFQKRYDPEKRYVYILQVKRESQVGYMNLYRTYKEFCELYQKLCLHFPLAKLHSLSTGLHMGRSNIKQVAAKRFTDVSLFVQSLFKTADEIAHSDLVYTFFHPLLRDQQSPEYYTMKAKDRLSEEKSDVGMLKGQLKLSIGFNKGVFTVMIHHVRCLPLLSNGQEPSTYVKVYLQPDPTKSTKRKTKVVKRNCHPSFMEMLEYRLALDIVKNRILKATVWNHDTLQENEFLGGVELDLSQFDLTVETTEWYSVTNLSR